MPKTLLFTKNVEIGELKKIDAKDIIYLFHKSGNPIDEALMIERLMKDRTQHEVATILEISQGQISKRLRLLKLHPILQERLRSGQLRPSTAYILSKLPPEAQQEYVNREKVTLKEVEAKHRQQVISKEFMDLVDKPFPELPFAGPQSQGEWRKARKKPVVVEFREVDGDNEVIHTLEGDLTAQKGRDFIIRGVNGEIYPIAKEIFYQTYEVVEN